MIKYLLPLALITLFAGCASTHQQLPQERFQNSANGEETAAPRIVVAVDKMLTYGKGLDKEHRKVIVCLEPNCKVPAPAELVERVEKELGLETTPTLGDADYRMIVETLMTKEYDGRTRLVKDILPYIFTPFPAGNLKPWLKEGRSATNDVKVIGKAGDKLWQIRGAMPIGYDHTATQLGQLGQQLSGGSGAGFVVGVLALPVLAISSNLFNLNSLEEGLFGTRITFLGNGVGIHRYAYGYAASDKEEDAGVLARAAFDGAMAMAKEIVEK